MGTERYDELLGNMVSEYTKLSGHAPDKASDIGIRLQVFAKQLQEIWDRVDEIDRQAFPLSSSGAFLDMHAAARGLVRKSAVHAIGQVVFSRAYPAAADIVIPAGTICQTTQKGGINVETTEEAVLPTGESAVTVPARAAVGGESGNILPGRVAVIVTPVSGISGCANPQAFCGGADEESDEQLKGRLRILYAAIPNGTNAAFYETEARTHPEVESVRVICVPRGLGSVDVVLWGAGSAVSSGVTQEVRQHLEHLREVNVDLDVYGATPVTCDVAISVAPVEGADFDAVTDNCRQTVRAYFRALSVGESLLLSQLVRALAETRGVYNVAVTQPVADRHILAHQVLVCGDINIERMAVS